MTVRTPALRGFPAGQHQHALRQADQHPDDQRHRPGEPFEDGREQKPGHRYRDRDMAGPLGPMRPMRVRKAPKATIEPKTSGQPRERR
jgi:hypothetical protein